MSENILESTKKTLGLSPENTAFDLDVLTHINAAFSVLHQLGVGPEEGVVVDDTSLWAVLELSTYQLGMAKTYVYLKVRGWFDPPTTSFHIGAMKEQIQELEFRINANREFELVPPVEEP
jgi:hypothetical protein